MHRAAALHEAEGVPATPDPREPMAESANVVRLAEGTTPTPRAGGCCFQACLVVPIRLCWQWVCILMCAGLLQERALLIRILGHGCASKVAVGDCMLLQNKSNHCAPQMSLVSLDSAKLAIARAPDILAHGVRAKE